MNYTSLPHHGNLGIIWKYYPSLVYLRVEKLFKTYHIIFFLYSHITTTYDFLDGYFNHLKKGLKYWLKNLEIYKTIPIEIFFWHDFLKENYWGWL
jgi:hypothetical protein